MAESIALETASDPQRQGAAGQAHEPDSFRVVGVGASAGGLEACTTFLAALPADTGMAFILVQHLEPNHGSLMPELLAPHTSMPVREATHGMRIERDHLYIIPPNTYLSVGGGALLLEQPKARHGARLPFDFLLQSLAHEFGARAVCVVLSGAGADGSVGLEAVKRSGGFVIAQTPSEAGASGMPTSAIMTGAVDLVLPATDIPQALVSNRPSDNHPHLAPPLDAADEVGPHLAEIVALLHAKTGQDFHPYKPGTLRRRIERRMTMMNVAPGGGAQYLAMLQRDSDELDLLAKDLLIHVTQFFRDRHVFDLLAERIIPDLIRNHPADQVLRIWTAGCSTGEETYSLAMLFHEAIEAARLNIPMQIYASDLEPSAIAFAREGVYPASTVANISADRLARFFTLEAGDYTVSPRLRSCVTFTVQDVLTDPPFSRLDFISCRNLLIYLSPQAQAKVISLFHFSLRPDGVLLLGSSETAGAVDGSFEVISKPERLYRRIGRHRAGDAGPFGGVGVGARSDSRRAHPYRAPARPTGSAELCKHLVLDAYAPATVLINRRHECLYFLGATEKYLRVPPGSATHDLLAMVSPSLRTKLKAAVERVDREHTTVIAPRGGRDSKGNPLTFRIEVRAASSEDDELRIVSFVEERDDAQRTYPMAPGDPTRVSELERELAEARAELESAIESMELSQEDQDTIREEALSASEEFQSTNEELVTSKEELQSLNEELTALNNQLHETLERQRTTADDLQNVLYSTDVATLFLDNNLKIRFFTPATKSLFNVIPGDVGRPLADLHSLAADGALLGDAEDVLTTFVPREREVEAQRGLWFSRRVLPYRAHDGRVEGVVITFTDITERKRTADALDAAKRQAEMADAAKSRFLAAASHDLRQPLQSLALLQGLLARTVSGQMAGQLVARQDQTLGAILRMLNTLLDINQIETGAIRPEIKTFPLNDLLERLKDEFSYHAEAQALSFHVVPCALLVHSDPRLLEQMLRNLLSNAFKHTTHGKVLLGCRRHADQLSIEVWDTGIGIADENVSSIFEEYVQVDNPARASDRGVGLGLSIVQRLSQLLDHRVSVRSRLGRGSLFAIETPCLAPPPAAYKPEDRMSDADDRASGHSGAILVVEDDSDVRELLDLLLRDAGHRVVLSPDGVAALDRMERDPIRPDLILADYNLPNAINGLQLIAKLRERLNHTIPAIILTGDISADVLRNFAIEDCILLTKPVTPQELNHAIERLLPAARPRARSLEPALAAPVVVVIDDESLVREGVRAVLEYDGYRVEEHKDAEAFLVGDRRTDDACLLIDTHLPGMTGLDLLKRLRRDGDLRPAIVITGRSDVTMAVEAMKAGASDFLEKPVGRDELLASVERALEQAHDAVKLASWREAAAQSIATLTARERQIMDLVLAGAPSKNIAADLSVSQRTVENHRAAIMKKTGSKSLPALVRLALAAAARSGNSPKRTRSC